MDAQSHKHFTKGPTFVKVFNAGVVKRLCNNFLQAVFAASAAGVHFHVAEAQLLQQTEITTCSSRRTQWSTQLGVFDGEKNRTPSFMDELKNN